MLINTIYIYIQCIYIYTVYVLIHKVLISSIYVVYTIYSVILYMWCI